MRVARDAQTGELVVSFRYNQALVEFVKALGGGRFQPATREWRFPAARAAELVPALAKRGFQISDEARGPETELDAADRDGVRVRDIAVRAAETIARDFATPIWLFGELQGVERSRGAHFLFGEIVDRSADGQVTAALDLFGPRGVREELEAALRPWNLTLSDGLAVRLLGDVRFYAKNGKLRFVPRSIDAEWSAGKLLVRREQVLAQVRAEGIADRNLSLPFPDLPLRVALVTSRGSDAYHDFLTALRESGYPFRVTVFDVRVQGPELEGTVTAALRQIASRAAAFDIAVVTRGGGSRTELASWDNLAVTRAIALLRLKAIVAIGHERDRSAPDEVALRCMTPTAAGKRVVEALDSVAGALGDWSERLAGAATGVLRDERARLRQTARGLNVAVPRALASSKERAWVHWPRRLARAASTTTAASRERALLQWPRRLSHAANAGLTLARRFERSATGRLSVRRIGPRLAGERWRWERAWQIAQRRLSDRMRRERERLDRQERSVRQTASRDLAHAGDRLAALDARLRLSDPQRVLERGFAIVRDATGRAMREVTALAPGSSVTVSLARGAFGAVVESVAMTSDRSVAEEEQK